MFYEMLWGVLIYNALFIFLLLKILLKKDNYLLFHGSEI